MHLTGNSGTHFPTKKPTQFPRRRKNIRHGQGNQKLKEGGYLKHYKGTVVTRDANIESKYLTTQIHFAALKMIQQ